MSLPASDHFSGSDWTGLATYNPSWTIKQGAFTLVEQHCFVDVGGLYYACARWNSDLFDNNQFAQGVYYGNASGHIGVAVRISTGSDISYYGFTGNIWETRLYKFVDGVYTQLGAYGPGLVAYDVIRLEVSGTTLTPYINGSVCSIGAQTDSSLASGAAGICGYNGSPGIDDWEGGNLVSNVVLLVNNCLHSHSVNELSLIQKQLLAVNDCSHSQSVDSLVLIQKQLLSVADTVHGHFVDSISLVQHFVLSVSDTFHSQIADSLNLGTRFYLEVESCLHSHTSETVSLSLHFLLQVADARHTVISDRPALVQKFVLTVSDSLHQHKADEFVLVLPFSTSGGTLLPDGSRLYRYPDTFTEITLNGESIMDLLPYEVRVWPNGWGWVLAKKLSPSDQIKTQIDNQTRNHYQYGNIVVTP